MEQKSEQPNSQPTLMNLNEHKAGLQGLDKEKINKIIHDASKGSSFETFQKHRQKKIDKEIEMMLKKLSHMTELQKNAAKIEADKMAKELEKRTDLSKIIVHIDMDMFFAAVEIRDNPQLKDKPVAVGSAKSIVSTSNYVARQYGVRAAMAGFIAKQLCPNLVFVKSNFRKYHQASEIVMKIIAEYDPFLNEMSLDEAYFDLTDYVTNLFDKEYPSFDLHLRDLKSEGLPNEMWILADKVVNEIREKIFAITKLTASAGIASNSRLAKVCSDINKPNGQFMLIGTVDNIKDFLSKTQVRKMSGVGPVRGQYLEALNIKTCSDLWLKRDVIYFLFTPHSVKYYLKVALGLGSTHFYNDDSRKSKSCERTCGEMSKVDEIVGKIKDLSYKIAKELEEENIKGKTVTLKLKKTSFFTILKSRSIPTYTCDPKVIFETAKIILDNILYNLKPAEAKFRLVGVKVSNFCEEELLEGQTTLSGIFKKQANKEESELKVNETDANLYDEETFNCSICGKSFNYKTEFETHESACIEQIKELSNDESDNLFVSLVQDDQSSNDSTHDTSNVSNVNKALCPVCFMPKTIDEMNQHLDLCLNVQTCRELTQVTASSSSNTHHLFCFNKKTPKKIPKQAQKKDKTKPKKRKIVQELNCTQRKIDNYFNPSKP